MTMLFSQRYSEAIKKGRVTVDLSADVRKKIWIWLKHHDATVRVQRDPNDSWTSYSSVLEEIEDELKAEHGWDAIPGTTSGGEPT